MSTTIGSLKQFFEQNQPTLIEQKNCLFSVSRVTDKLYMGSYYSLTKALDTTKCTSVVSIMLRPPDLSNRYVYIYDRRGLPQRIKVNQLRVSIDDIETSNLAQFLPRISDFICRENAAGKRVYVHCHMGISRSATCIIYYLLKYTRSRLLDCIKYLHKKRPCIHPNDGFLMQLIDAERQIDAQRTWRPDYI